MCIECCHDRYFVSALFHSLRIPQKSDSVKVHFGVKIGSFLGHGQKLEKSELKKFENSGGKIYYYDAYVDSFKPSDFSGRWYDAYDIVKERGKKIASVNERNVDLKFSEDEKEYAISVIDFAEEPRKISNLEIVLHAKTSGERCTFSDGNGDVSLPVICGDGGKKIIIPEVVNGGIIFVSKG